MIKNASEMLFSFSTVHAKLYKVPCIASFDAPYGDAGQMYSQAVSVSNLHCSHSSSPLP